MSRRFLFEFDDAPGLLEAIPELRRDGLQPAEAFTPFAIDGLAESLGHRRPKVRVWMLGGGVGGALLAFGFQTWSAVIDYPINSGGRPLFSWPAFIPIAFEMMVFGAAVTGFVILLRRCGLPRLHHNAFDLPGFERVSDDRFLLLVGSEAPREELDAAGIEDRYRWPSLRSVTEVAA